MDVARELDDELALKAAGAERMEPALSSEPGLSEAEHCRTGQRGLSSSDNLLDRYSRSPAVSRGRVSLSMAEVETARLSTLVASKGCSATGDSIEHPFQDND
ncbi:hypothetical protein SLS58_009244 [Diplodia intermedia]|uniref:Uncharacterized protein n=1 Tax=Diplodia intermedia TaxID=856260 RepID=A0ABR3TDJ6_9PEZI